MRKLSAITLFTIAILGTSICYAGSTTRASKTKEYHEAFAAFESDHLDKAYKILVPLVEKIPAFDAIGLLGQTELALGKYREAAEHLSLAIRNTPQDKAAEALPIFKQDLETAKARVVTLRIVVDKPDAEITIDNKVINKSPVDYEIYVEPGSRTILATHPTDGSAKSVIDVAAGESRVINLTIGKADDNKAIAPLKYKPSDLDKPSKFEVNQPPVNERHSGIETKTIVLIAGGAVTLAAGVTATVFGLKARSAEDDADSLAKKAANEYGDHRCSSPAAQGSALCADIRSKLDDHDSAARVFNIMLPIAGIAAVTTGILYAVLPSKSTRESSSKISFVPFANEQSRGLIIQGSF
jgi:tetratricopeptide (TPR) repeat protein